MRSGKWRREGGGGEEERGVEGDKWENLRHRLFCNQGENLCGRGKITNTRFPLKDLLTLGYLPFGKRKFTLAFPDICLWEEKATEDKKYTYLPYMWREFTYALKITRLQYFRKPKHLDL